MSYEKSLSYCIVKKERSDEKAQVGVYRRGKKLVQEGAQVNRRWHGRNGIVKSDSWKRGMTMERNGI